MDIGKVVDGLGGEAIRQLLLPAPEPPLSGEIEDLEDELEKWRLRLEAIEDEGVISARRLGWLALGFGAVLLVAFVVSRFAR